MKDHNEMKQYIEQRLARGLDTPELDGREVLALLEEVERLNRESQNLSDQLGACDRERRQYMAESEALRKGSLSLDDFDLDAEMTAMRNDADRYRWLCDGNGYFLEEQGICGHSNEKPEADRQIDITMSTGERP